MTWSISQNEESKFWISSEDIDKLGDYWVDKALGSVSSVLTAIKGSAWNDKLSDEIESIVAPYRRVKSDPDVIREVINDKVDNPEFREYMLNELSGSEIPNLPNPFPLFPPGKYIARARESERLERKLYVEVQRRMGVKQFSDMPMNEKRDLVKKLLVAGEKEEGVPSSFYKGKRRVLKLDDVYNQDLLTAMPD